MLQLLLSILKIAGATLLIATIIVILRLMLIRPDPNNECLNRFNLLKLEISKCQSERFLASIEDLVDDFYNEYAGRAQNAKLYADELYSLLAAKEFTKR